MALEPTRFDDLVFNRIAYRYGAHLHLPNPDDFNRDCTAFSFFSLGEGPDGVSQHELIPIVDCLPLLVAEINDHYTYCFVDRYGWCYENDYYDGPNATGETVSYRVLVTEGYAPELDARNHEGTPEQKGTSQTPDPTTVTAEALNQMHPQELERLLGSFVGRIDDLLTLLPQLMEAKVRVEMAVQARPVPVYPHRQ